jgi:hypothetical protein
MNPNSGPGEMALEPYSKWVTVARKRGIKVIGYTHTEYTKRSIDRVKEEITRYKEWYGVDGIFVDQVPTELEDLAYYRALASFVRARPGLLTVLNPGTFPHQEYMDVADVLCVFDGCHSDHLVRQAPAWVANYPPKRFWHIVYDATTAREMRLSLRASAGMNAGLVFITDAGLPNPFSRLPSYWRDEIAEA